MYENLAHKIFSTLEYLTKIIRLENNTGARWSFIYWSLLTYVHNYCVTISCTLQHCGVLSYTPARALLYTISASFCFKFSHRKSILYDKCLTRIFNTCKFFSAKYSQTMVHCTYNLLSMTLLPKNTPVTRYAYAIDLNIHMTIYHIISI